MGDPRDRPGVRVRPFPAGHVTLITWLRSVFQWLWRRENMSANYETVFARYDTDGDGRLTADEVTSAIAGMFPAAEVNDLSGIVKALFAQYDVDHDGLLSVTEFIPLAENLPELGS
jgi:Ca2+-binding EF-hand superfamily protein